MQFSMQLVSFLAILLSAVIVSPFQFMQPKRILPSSREQLLRGQLAYLKGIAIAQQQDQDQFEPFEGSLMAKRLRGEPIRFGKRSPREPIRFGKRFNPISDYDFP